MLIRQYVALLLLRAVARTLWRLIKAMAAAAVIIAAAPVSLVAAGAAVTPGPAAGRPAALRRGAVVPADGRGVAGAAALSAPGSAGYVRPAWYGSRARRTTRG